MVWTLVPHSPIKRQLIEREYRRDKRGIPRECFCIHAENMPGRMLQWHDLEEWPGQRLSKPKAWRDFISCSFLD